MKVTILNAHSTLNPGDTGIVLGQISFLRKYFPGIAISITSRTPEIDRSFYEPLGIRVLEPFLPAPSNFPDRKVRGFIKNLLNLRAKVEVFRTLLESTLVFLSGGGYFYSYRRSFPGPTFFQDLVSPILAATLRKPIVFFPQSIGPFRNPFAILATRKIIESDRVRRVFLRERVSLDNLTKIVKEKDRSKLALCPDMAFLIEEAALKEFNFREEIALPKPLLGLTLREWTFPSYTREKGEMMRKAYLNSLVEIAMSFYAQFKGSILIIPQVWGPGSFEDDRPISKEFYLGLKEKIPEENLCLFDNDEVLSPYYLIKLFSMCDIFIGTRFHSCIFAFLAGVPFISIGYQHKSSGIMEMLGLGRFSLDISEVSKEMVISLIEEILNHPEEIRSSLRRNMELIKNETENILLKEVVQFLS
ncbi:MAG TPA: polysaccharide pyruvyl transferase family protein [Candidatus Hypogeohydataceae bacterium YC41]